MRKTGARAWRKRRCATCPTTTTARTCGWWRATRTTSCPSSTPSHRTTASTTTTCRSCGRLPSCRTSMASPCPRSARTRRRTRASSKCSSGRTTAPDRGTVTKSRSHTRSVRHCAAVPRRIHGPRACPCPSSRRGSTSLPRSARWRRLPTNDWGTVVRPAAPGGVRFSRTPRVFASGGSPKRFVEATCTRCLCPCLQGSAGMPATMACTARGVGEVRRRRCHRTRATTFALSTISPLGGWPCRQSALPGLAAACAYLTNWCGRSSVPKAPVVLASVTVVVGVPPRNLRIHRPRGRPGSGQVERLRTAMRGTCAKRTAIACGSSRTRRRR